mmetsp:Transcript_39652/g.123520  ORF Transcript_39652/g.123520 Transcript_39652/m.123520 type:complete len:286 (+) Transcript_39652:148-1005(+)
MVQVVQKPQRRVLLIVVHVVVKVNRGRGCTPCGQSGRHSALGNVNVRDEDFDLLTLLEVVELLPQDGLCQKCPPDVLAAGVLHDREGAEVHLGLDLGIEELVAGEPFECRNVPECHVEHRKGHPLALHIHRNDAHLHHVAEAGLPEGVHLRAMYTAGNILPVDVGRHEDAVVLGVHYGADKPLVVRHGLHGFIVHLPRLVDQAEGDFAVVHVHLFDADRQLLALGELSLQQLRRDEAPLHPADVQQACDVDAAVGRRHLNQHAEGQQSLDLGLDPGARGQFRKTL